MPGKADITPLPGYINQDSRRSEQAHKDYPHHQCTASFFAFCRKAGGFPAKSSKKHSECSFVWAHQLHQPPPCQGKMYLRAFLAYWLYLLKEHYGSWISNSQLGFYLLFKPAQIIGLILLLTHSALCSFSPRRNWCCLIFRLICCQDRGYRLRGWKRLEHGAGFWSLKQHKAQDLY